MIHALLLLALADTPPPFATHERFNESSTSGVYYYRWTGERLELVRSELGRREP